MKRLHPNRREFVAAGVAAGTSTLLPRPLLAQGAQPKIVVIGGGFAGLTAARMAKLYDPKLEVTLVEANPTYTACPFSNDVIAGLRDIKEQQFGYEQDRQRRRHHRPGRPRRASTRPRAR